MSQPVISTEAPSEEELRAEAAQSSEKNRNFFIATLGLQLYVQVIVASTTDLQILLLNEGIRLPFVDVYVPLLGFYIAAPLFVLAMHFNLLQNLESHLYKLRGWANACPDNVPRHRIQPFIFDFALLERDGRLTGMVRFFTYLLVLWLTPFTLLMILWRMTDFQELWLTGWHYFVFLVDMLIICRFCETLAGKQEESHGGGAIPPLCRVVWHFVGCPTHPLPVPR